MIRGRHQLRHRRGGTLTGLLVTLSIIGALGVTTVIVAPQYLSAGVEPPQPQAVTARLHEHQQLIDDLAGLIARSIGTIAIHPRGATPYEEIVLWLADGQAEGTAGRADEAELAVLSHSSVLHTITVYRLEDPEAERSRTVVVPRSSPAFCERWRADPRVGSLVLGRGVSDMRVETVGDAQDQWELSGTWGGLQRLRLTLTWASDSADGADEASVLIDTVMFPSGAGGSS